MSKAIGAPVTITNGQKVRENIAINVAIATDATGAQTFTLTAIGQYVIRDGSGNVIWLDPVAVSIATIQDAQLPTAVKNGLLALSAHLDTK